jgi:hypothetical protein
MPVHRKRGEKPCRANAALTDRTALWRMPRARRALSPKGTTALKREIRDSAESAQTEGASKAEEAR